MGTDTQGCVNQRILQPAPSQNARRKLHNSVLKRWSRSVASTGKKYVGQDLNELAVDESNEIVKFLNLPNASTVTKDIEESSGTYKCLFTCPPYGRKETYSNEIVFKTCDDWIADILTRFDCKKYVFVVDETVKYKDFVEEELKSTSHFVNFTEKLIVINKGDLNV